MKNNIFTIMKKEFARFFGDRRMIIVLILPGIMIYVVYSVLGAALINMNAPDTEYLPQIYVVNMPEALKGDIMEGWAWTQLLSVGTAEIPNSQAAKEKVAMKEADLSVIFPPDFDKQVEIYDARTATGLAPNIEIYFNSADTYSMNAYGKITELLEAYEYSLAHKFDINRGIAVADLATEEESSAFILSTLMPMMLLMFLFSGCTAIAPESIAGEKERGTIGALLVSPLKRSQLAVGKILSLGVLAFLAGLVSTVATILALPKVMGADGSISANIYGVNDYITLALVIISTILLLVTFISIISAFAKTVKEATTAVTPLMFVVMIVGITAMFGSGAQTERIYYLIPIYNSVQSMSGVFSLEYSSASVALAVLSNLVYACAGGFVLTKMFNSEKVMFSR